MVVWCVRTLLKIFSSDPDTAAGREKFSNKQSHSLLKWPTKSISFTHRTLLHTHTHTQRVNASVKQQSEEQQVFLSVCTCWWQWCWSFCVQDTEHDLWTLHRPAVWSLNAAHTNTNTHLTWSSPVRLIQTSHCDQLRQAVLEWVLNRLRGDVYKSIHRKHKHFTGLTGLLLNQYNHTIMSISSSYLTFTSSSSVSNPCHVSLLTTLLQFLLKTLK